MDNITCTTLPTEIHKWHNNIVSLIKSGEKRPRAANIKIPDAQSCYTDFLHSATKKSLLLGMHGHGFSCKKKATKENICVS